MVNVTKTKILPIVSLCIIALGFIYYKMSQGVLLNSDGATGILQAKSIADGNVLLHGWTLSTGTYYTTDLVYYVLGILLFGVSAKSLFVVTSLIYACMVAVAIFISGKHKQGFSIAKAAVTFAIIGIPTYFVSTLVFSGPMHTSGIVYILVSLCFIEFATKKVIRYGAYSLCLILALFGDPFVIWYFILPVLAVNTIRIIVKRDREDFYLLGCTILSVASAKILLILTGFVVPSVGAPTLLEFSKIGSNVSLTIQGYLQLFGAFFFGGSPTSPRTLIVMLHLLGLAAFIFVITRTIKRIKSNETGRLEQILLSIIFINTAEYLLSNMPIDLNTTRYLLPSFIAGAVLVGKYGLTDSLLKYNKIITASSLVYAITFFQIVHIDKRMHDQLKNELIAKNLSHGYGMYWDSSAVTVLSGEKVRIRPILNNNSRLESMEWLTEKGWYKAPSNFIVIDKSNYGGLNENDIQAYIGTADSKFNVGNYTVMVWDRDISGNIYSKE